jgi:hypothetical protein
VAVQRRAQALLVEVVTNETNRTTEDEQAIQSSNLDVLVRLFARERAGVAQEIDEANRNASINIEDKCVLLGCRHLFDRERVVEQRMAREVLQDILLHKLDSQIGVVHTLNLVANTRDCKFSVNTQGSLP